MNLKNKIFFFLLIPCLLSLISGCGYTTEVKYPAKIKTIHVDMFDNEIDITKEVSANDRYEVYEPGLEVELRDAIVERIFLDGHLRITSKNKADAVLTGEILRYRKDPLRYRDEDITEYRISLICNVKLSDLSTKETLMENNNLIGDVSYFTTGSLQKSETQALKDAASDLARRIVNEIVENW